MAQDATGQHPADDEATRRDAESRELVRKLKLLTAAEIRSLIPQARELYDEADSEGLAAVVNLLEHGAQQAERNAIVEQRQAELLSLAIDAIGAGGGRAELRDGRQVTVYTTDLPAGLDEVLWESAPGGPAVFRARHSGTTR